MAQDRMLRESLRTSEKVNDWPIPLRFFWTQLWGYCDDWGRGRYDSRLIVADTFPIDDEVTAAMVGRWMQALELAEVIRPYEVDGKKYFVCVNWDEHQEISYRKKTTMPDEFGSVPKAGYLAKVSKDSETFQNISKNSGASKGKGREVEGEVEGKVQAPTPFCIKHPTGTDAPCRACGNARRAHDVSLELARKQPTPAPRKGDPDPTSCVHAWTDNYCAKCLTRREENAA